MEARVQHLDWPLWFQHLHETLLHEGPLLIKLKGREAGLVAEPWRTPTRVSTDLTRVISRAGKGSSFPSL